jgi:hypothetical protein
MIHSSSLAYCPSCREICETPYEFGGPRRTLCAKGHRLSSIYSMSWDADGWYEYVKRANRWILSKVSREEVILRAAHRLGSRYRPRK